MMNTPMTNTKKMAASTATRNNNLHINYKNSALENQLEYEYKSILHDFVADFRHAIAASGLVPPDQIVANGTLRRFSSSGKPQDNAGWYVLHGGTVPAGIFGCWRKDFSQTWKVNRKLSKREERQFKKQIKEARHQAQIERLKDQKQAAIEAVRIWNVARPANPDHPYLARKGIHPYGIKEYHGDLVIPLYDENGNIVNVQKILPKKTNAGLDKIFLKGARKKGCYFLIGDIEEEKPLCICEGYATGVSIYEEKGYPVVVAFDAGNLKPVSKYFRKVYPDKKIVICADDDYKTELEIGINPGIRKANEAARLIGATVAIPKFPTPRPEGATDFNDLHQIQRGVYGRS